MNKEGYAVFILFHEWRQRQIPKPCSKVQGPPDNSLPPRLVQEHRGKIVRFHSARIPGCLGYQVVLGALGMHPTKLGDHVVLGIKSRSSAY